MSRPTLDDVDHGVESWDTIINDNKDKTVNAPFPVKEYATVAALLAVNPTAYDRCVAVTADTGELWVSDGTAWRLLMKGHLNANGARGGLKIATIELTALAGASVSWNTVAGSNPIPAGAFLLGVSLFVTTLITGAASFDVGDGTDVDRFAAAVAVAQGTTKTPADATADPTGWAAAARDIVLTANGGNFTAGAVRLVALYIDLTAPTS